MFKLILVLIAVLVLIIPSQAYFKDIGLGVRPMGMGGAYTALADDANASLWNSAGLSQIKKHEIMLAYASIYTGLKLELYNGDIDQLGHHFISYVRPLDSGGIGLSWNTFQSTFYDENTLCLSYGRRLFRSLYTGINLKRLEWSIDINDYSKLDDDISNIQTSRDGFTIDLGFLLKPKGKYTLGFSAENIFPVNLGLNTEEIVSTNLRSGIAYRVGIANIAKLLVLIDTTYRKRDHILDSRIGSELWLMQETTAIRLGLNSNSITSGLSYRLKLAKTIIQMDYAFIYSLTIENTYGSHRISLCLKI